MITPAAPRFKQVKMSAVASAGDWAMIPAARSLIPPQKG